MAVVAAAAVGLGVGLGLRELEMRRGRKGVDLWGMGEKGKVNPEMVFWEEGKGGGEGLEKEEEGDGEMAAIFDM